MSYLTLNNKQIYYEVHGEGRPLIILNGIMMSTSSWHMFIPDFKAYQLILIDFFDQGRSDSIDESYTHQLQIQVVEAVVNTLELKDITLVGISYGAEIALQYALINQNRLKNLVIYNGTAKTSYWLKDIGIAWQLAARTNNGNLFYHVAIPYVYSSGYYSDNEEWFKKRKDQLMEIFTPQFLRRMDRLIESSRDYDIKDSLDALTIPTWIVAGDSDYITPIGESRILHNSIKQSVFITLNNCGHASMYEKPKEFVRFIKETSR